MKTPSLTLLTLGIFSVALLTPESADARRGYKHAKAKASKAENISERKAAKEEILLEKKDFKEEKVNGDESTPLLNKKQRKLEKRIDAALKDGRLSTAKANSLRRQLESLARMEATLKSGKLSTNDRERLHEKSIELTRKLNKELKD